MSKKTGRPTKYKPEFPALLLDYFHETIYERKKLPFLSLFARQYAGVCEDTAIEWTKVHPEFSEAYKKAKDMQKEFLIEQGLEGNYNTAFAIFTAKNITDMRDKQEVEHSGKDGEPMKMEIDIKNASADELLRFLTATSAHSKRSR